MSSPLQQGLVSFSLRLYKELSGGDGNVFVSPHSVTSALMLALLGARGKTEGQIITSLGFGARSADDCHAEYKKINDVLQKLDSDGTLLRVANRIYVGEGRRPTDKFAKEVKDFYSGGIESINFSSPTSNQVINAWVEEQTNTKIKNLIPEPLDPLTTNVLVNAIYYKGLWETQFKSENTVKSDFNVTKDSVVQVDMMKQKLKLPFHIDQELGLTATELSYQSGSVTMVILLPTEVDGLANIEKNLTDVALSNVFESLKSARKPDVNVGLPRFKMEASCSMSKILASLGITDLFDAQKADMSGLLEGPNTEVSKVLHKAFIEVNEEGTEVAAATAMISKFRMMPMPEQSFICDRPFLLVLLDRETGTILFIGRYSKPE